MEQANEILEYLREQHSSHYSTEANEGVAGYSDNDRLGQWNDRLEDLIFGPIEDQLKALPQSLDESECEILTAVSKELHRHFLRTLLPASSTATDDNDSPNIDKIMETCDSKVLSLKSRPRLHQVIRAVRNWMRFYLQIYPVLEASRLSVGALVGSFQQNDMLRLYLHLTEQLLMEQPELARFAALILFYATFQPVPGASARAVTQFLVQDLDLPRRVLQLYLGTDSIGVALALTQIIHNLVGSAPCTSSSIRAVQVEPSEVSSGCPWMPSADGDDDAMSYRTVWDRLLEYCLCNDSNSSFPGDSNDYRAELVGEILRTLFALRIGASLTTREQNLVPVILQLDTADPRSLECQHAVMTILTEADASMASVLASESMGALLKLLELQIDAVVSASRVDDAAAASLTPVLVTFYRFCQVDADFLQQTRQAVFPEDRTPVASQNSNPMQPADAPDGTLRHKLIRLLTWPQGHIKRFAAEILWLLCNSNPQEFGRRVGMGNALPFLTANGYAQMPTGVIQ